MDFYILNVSDSVTRGKDSVPIEIRCYLSEYNISAEFNRATYKLFCDPSIGIEYIISQTHVLLSLDHFVKIVNYALKYNLDEIYKVISSRCSSFNKSTEIRKYILMNLDDDSMKSELCVELIKEISYYAGFGAQVWQFLICKKIDAAKYFVSIGYNPNIPLEHYPLDDPNFAEFLDTMKTAKIMIPGGDISVVIRLYIEKSVTIPLFSLLSSAFSFGAIAKSVHILYDHLHYCNDHSKFPGNAKKLATCILEIKKCKKDMLEKYAALS